MISVIDKMHLGSRFSEEVLPPVEVPKLTIFTIYVKQIRNVLAPENLSAKLTNRALKDASKSMSIRLWVSEEPPVQRRLRLG